MTKLFKRISLASGVLAASGAACAEGVDVSSVTTSITAAGVAIGTVGAAVLVMYVGGKVYKWIRGAM